MKLSRLPDSEAVDLSLLPAGDNLLLSNLIPEAAGERGAETRAKAIRTGGGDADGDNASPGAATRAGAWTGAGTGPGARAATP